MSFDTSQKPLNREVNTSGVDFYLDFQIDLRIVDLGLREGKTLTQSHADTEQQSFISSWIAPKVKNIWCGWSPRRTEK